MVKVLACRHPVVTAVSPAHPAGPVPRWDEVRAGTAQDEPTGPHPVPVPEEDLTCSYDPTCGQPAAYGVSLGGERYRPACWEHALFSAVPQARRVTTVELAPLDWAFDADAPPG